MQSRWKSPVLWASIVGQLVSIALLLGLFGEPFGAKVTEVVGMVLQLLVLVGVLNNPENPEAF